MIDSSTYTKVVAETQQQTIKAVESGFEFAARVLDLQKKYTLGVANLIASATPPAQD